MRKRLLHITELYAVAAIVLIGIFAMSRHRTQAGIQNRIQAVDDLLDTPVCVQDDRTLGEATDSIRSETGLPIIVKWDVLAAEGIDRKTPISIACHNEPMAIVLRRILRSAAGTSFLSYRALVALGPACNTWQRKDLGFYVDAQGNVIVTTFANVESTVCLYDVSDLMPKLDGINSEANRDIKQLLIGVGEQGTRVSDPNTYETIGAWCSDVDEVEFVPSLHRLLVKTTRDGHRRIARLFARLRSDPKLASRLCYRRNFIICVD